MPVTPPSATRNAASPPAGGYGKSLALLASLFFMWGFITVINNTLLPHLRSVFELNYTQTTIIESVWFIAYAVASMPSAFLIERVGYKKAIIIGLVIMAVGALGMVPAARIPSYGVTLVALFVIACGIALLQVAANPYVAVLGLPENSESRLTLVQAFNSMGTFFAPYFGGYLILSRTVSGTTMEGTVVSLEQRMADAHATQLPYVLVALALAALAFVISRAKLPTLGEDTRRANAEERKHLSLWKHRNLVFGIPAIFIYLIAEIGVANLFINFVSQPDIGNMTHAAAANYLIMLWGGMMVGRFAGAFIMRRAPADKVLAGFALFAMVVMIGAATLHGPIAMWALILVGLGHSIMFPTIFALGIKGLGPLTEEGSGLLITAIAGGALVVVQGWLADNYGLQNSFFLTAICELYVLVYALWGIPDDPGATTGETGMKKTVSLILAAALGAALAQPAAARPVTDCPLRDAPFTIESPLIDILLSPAAKAVLEQDSPGRLDKAPPQFLGTTPPTFAAILTPREAIRFTGVKPDALPGIDAALRALPVNSADKVARCARYDNDIPRFELPAGKPHLLLFEKINGFRDTPSVNAAHAAFLAMAERKGWAIAVTDKGGAFNPATLRRFDAVIWNNISGDVLTLSQRRAFQSWLANGGAFVGVHGSAGDPVYFWDWYVDKLLGARFLSHPMGPQFQDARVAIDDPNHPVAKGLPREWTMNDEWYSFKTNPRAAGAKIIATLDESTYSPVGMMKMDLRMGDHPIAWTNCIGQGRMFYSAIGHRPETYSEPHYVTMLESAIDWAAVSGKNACLAQK